MSDRSRMPVSVFDASDAVSRSRLEARHETQDWNGMCLKFVRTCWGLPGVYASAAQAWDRAEDRHPFTNSRDIPFGAPVFSQSRTGSRGFGHVFIAGGYVDGKRIFRSTDIRGVGDVSAVFLNAFIDKWDHEILGWTGDLNGYDLRLNGK